MLRLSLPAKLYSIWESHGGSAAAWRLLRDPELLRITSLAACARGSAYSRDTWVSADCGRGDHFPAGRQIGDVGVVLDQRRQATKIDRLSYQMLRSRQFSA